MQLKETINKLCTRWAVADPFIHFWQCCTVRSQLLFPLDLLIDVCLAQDSFVSSTPARDVRLIRTRWLLFMERHAHMSSHADGFVAPNTSAYPLLCKITIFSLVVADKTGMNSDSTVQQKAAASFCPDNLWRTKVYSSLSLCRHTPEPQNWTCWLVHFSGAAPLHYAEKLFGRN